MDQAAFAKAPPARTKLFARQSPTPEEPAKTDGQSVFAEPDEALDEDALRALHLRTLFREEPERGRQPSDVPDTAPLVLEEPTPPEPEVAQPEPLVATRDDAAAKPVPARKPVSPWVLKCVVLMGIFAVAFLFAQPVGWPMATLFAAGTMGLTIAVASTLSEVVASAVRFGTVLLKSSLVLIAGAGLILGLAFALGALG